MAQAQTTGARDALAHAMRRWQEVEASSIDQTVDISRSSRCAFVRLVMEIIRRDSAMHRRVQRFILESLEKQGDPASAGDLLAVRAAVAAHARAEAASVELSMEAAASLGESPDPVLEYLLAYLELDEAKHDRLLEGLEKLADSLSRR